MNLEKRQLMEAGAFAWDSIKNYVKRALPSTMLITRKMNGEEVDKCKGRWVCGGHCEQYSTRRSRQPHTLYRSDAAVQ